MDPAQFQELLKTITASNERLAALLASSKTEAADVHKSTVADPSTVTFLSNFEQFNSSHETFTQYKQRFENYLEMKNTFADKALCSRLLLNCIGSELYTLLSSLIAPKLPNELTYDELISALEKHLCPPPNVIIEQHRFLSRFQTADETIADYVAALRKYTSTCEFKCECGKSVSDVFLRAQFIRGLKDSNIREQLLIIPDLTFDKAVEQALAYEASKLDNLELSKNQSEKVPGKEVNKISKTRKTEISRNNSKDRKREFSIKRTRSVSRERTQLNFRELGIHNMCLRCGRSNHLSRQCRVNYKKLYCQACHRTGHVQKVCVSTLLKKTKGLKIQSIEHDKQYDDHVTDIDAIDLFSGVTRIIDIFQDTSNLSSQAENFFVEIQIENKIQKFEVDSGAGYTLLPKRNFDSLQLKTVMQPTNVKFRSYTHGIFEPLGVVEVPITYKNQHCRETLFIVPDIFSPVLGRTWIRRLNINLFEIDNASKHHNLEVKTINTSNLINDILNQFSDIFESKVGKIPNFTCSLKLRENAKPVFLKARDVPFALRYKVEQELDALENDNIITKVDCSDWGSPLVVVPKPDGSVRLCVDYKVAVNPQLQAAHYPIPKIDEILNSLRNAKIFCTLDLYKAYLHVEVDNESKIIQTISTHRGTFKVNRLSFGIKSAPSEFHRILDQILLGLKGITTYFDDIIIHGKTIEECRERLIRCLERLKKYDLHVNKSKCQFFKKSISYLGYVIEENKISKCPKKVEAIIHAPRPQNIEDVKRFLGIITYYSKFIPDTSTLTYPLRCLLKKNAKFNWSASCESAFVKLKDEIASDRVLIPYDTLLPITVACDASPTGISGVLSHIINGIEKPVAFASRSLTIAEQNYSQLDREALAIKFAVQKFHTYIYGKEFTLITDNKPLTRIFHHDAKLPAFTSSRLLRYATFLSEYHYKVQHRKSEDHTNADYLSRSSIKLRDPEILQDDDIIHLQAVNQISTMLITPEIISKETEKDSKLSILKHELLLGEIYDTDYSLQDGIIFKGHRIYIPETLRHAILKELHATHIGITKMKQLARRYVYWGKINQDIENLVKSCKDCAKLRHNPPKVVVHPWDIPEDNWERIHIDYAGPFQNQYFLICVDAKSKWLEIRLSRTAPTTSSTINLLKDIFSTHGFPVVLVSDNASIFTSTEFRTYCTTCGIFQKFIAPGHPATNGLAERNVQTFKRRLKSIINESGTLKEKVQKILFRYRATPLACGKSPAELYLNRKIRMELDAFLPISTRRLNSVSEPVRTLSKGERIQARVYQNNSEIWQFGVVTRKLGTRHYLVKLDSGRVLKRHINQLVSTRVPEGNIYRPKEINSSKSSKHVTFTTREICGNSSTRRDNEPPTELRIQNHNQDPVTKSTSSGDHSARPKPSGSSIPDTHSSCRRSNRIRHPPHYLSDYVT